MMYSAVCCSWVSSACRIQWAKVHQPRSWGSSWRRLRRTEGQDGDGVSSLDSVGGGSWEIRVVARSRSGEGSQEFGGGGRWDAKAERAEAKVSIVFDVGGVDRGGKREDGDK